MLYNKSIVTTYKTGGMCMRIAVMNNGRKVAEHPEETISFAIFDIIKGKGKVAVNVSTKGEGDALLFILKNEGAQVLLCGEINEAIRMQLEKQGIEVVSGLRGSIRRLIKAYTMGHIGNKQAKDKH